MFSDIVKPNDCKTDFFARARQTSGAVFPRKSKIIHDFSEKKHKQFYINKNHLKVKLPFDNLTFEDVYEARKDFSEKRQYWNDWVGKGGMFWDDFENKNRKKYMPLRNINDFLEQFNYVGFHDICNDFIADNLIYVPKQDRKKAGFY